MMKWNTLLARHGFQESDLHQSVSGEEIKIGGFLQKAIYLIENDGKNIHSITEETWFQFLNIAV